MLLRLAESDLLRDDSIVRPGEGRLALLNATNGIYRAAEQVCPGAVAFLQEDGAQVFTPEELDLAAEYLSSLQQPTIMQLLLHQWLFYRQLQARPLPPTIESADTFRIVLRRLVDKLISVDQWNLFHSVVCSVDPCDSEVDELDSDGDESDSDGEECEPSDERQQQQQLDDNDAWLWNPFASNAVLVGLLENLVGSPEKTDDFVGVLDLLASLFYLGPPRCRHSVTPATGSLLIKLYLERALDNTPLTRTIGFTLSTWVRNNAPAKTQLFDAAFMEHLDRMDLSLSNVPTMGLILQNWIHSDEVAQSTLLSSKTFRAMMKILSSLARTLLLSKQKALALYRICSVLLELHICKHDGGIDIALDIWPSLCRLLVESGRYHRFRFKCALLMRVMSSEAEEWGNVGLSLTPAARSTCEFVCALSTNERERKVFTALLPPDVYVYRSKPPSEGEFFDADLLL